MILLLTLLVAPATADVVQPVSERCPRGAVGIETHDGGYCGPSACPDGQAQCRDGLVCTPDVGLCIRMTETECGRDGRPCTRAYAVSSCTTDADCEDGVTCAIGSRCAERPPEPPPSPPEPAPGASGWLCSTVGAAPFAAFLFGLVPLALRRRAD